MTSTNPFAPPNAEVADPGGEASEAAIAALNVSEAWKQKFQLLHKAGGPRQPKLKLLSFGERMKIGFNVLAFLFGPLYYLAKGMWKKALTLFGACFVVIVVVSVGLEMLGFSKLANALGYGAAAVFAVRANIDYYKKMVLGDDGWW